MTALPTRGEVWWCELADVGRRPVVVLSRDAVNCCWYRDQKAALATNSGMKAMTRCRSLVSMCLLDKMTTK